MPHAAFVMDRHVLFAPVQYPRRLAARMHGATLAVLEVRESNAPAIGLYTELGFRTVGRRKGYYAKTNENALVMMKDLVALST